jgi:putative protease
VELVTYTATPEAVRAAVFNGADAVRLGLKGCSSFTSSFEVETPAFSSAVEYCRVRGVKVYLSLDTPVTDNAFTHTVNLAVKACREGVSAICSGDLGLLKSLRQLLIDIELHAAVSANIHDSSGIRLFEAIGVTRVLLPPQLTGELIRQLRLHTRLELEASCFGPSCIAYGGTCRMCAFTTKKRNSICTQPCRDSCGIDASSKADSFGLRLKDLSLAEHLSELSSIGLNALSITGANRRPEYSAMATGIFRKALDDGRPPSEHDMGLLIKAFTPSGTTAGFYEGKLDAEMLDLKGEPVKKLRTVLNSVRADYMRGDSQRVPVQFNVELKRGMNIRITATDSAGKTAGAVGTVPEYAGSGRRELTPALLKTQLYNTMGTPYLCSGVKMSMDTGLYLPSADISHVRNEALSRLTELRRPAPETTVAKLPELLKFEGYKTPPDLTFFVLKASQLSVQLAGTKPKVLYVPLSEIKASPSSITPFWENGITSICAVLPPIVTDINAIEVYRELYSLKELHINEVMINSLSQLTPAQVLGFKIRGGMNLNVTNSFSLKTLKELGLISATLSPDLSLEQIREISKCIDTELPAYGRLPLMVTEHCIVKSLSGVCSCESFQALRDKRGKLYPISRAKGCRSVLYSTDKLYIGDRLKDFEALGLWCLNLSFTTENARECASIAGRYLNLNKFEPNARTKGLYYD